MKAKRFVIILLAIVIWSAVLLELAVRPPLRPWLKQRSFERFQREVKSKIDPVELQHWATNLLAHHAGDYDFYFLYNSTNVPPSLQGVKGYGFTVTVYTGRDVKIFDQSEVPPEGKPHIVLFTGHKSVVGYFGSLSDWFFKKTSPIKGFLDDLRRIITGDFGFIPPQQMRVGVEIIPRPILDDVGKPMSSCASTGILIASANNDPSGLQRTYYAVENLEIASARLSGDIVGEDCILIFCETVQPLLSPPQFTAIIDPPFCDRDKTFSSEGNPQANTEQKPNPHRRFVFVTKNIHPNSYNQGIRQEQNASKSEA